MPIVAGPTGEEIEANRAKRRRETRNRARDARIAAGEADVRNKTRTEKRGRNEKLFISVDGEGVGEGRNHNYVLLGVGSEQVENPAGLEFDEIMNHLWAQNLANPGAVFTGFYLGYDFNQWIRKLPMERAAMLLTKEGRLKRERKVHSDLGPWPVQYGRWEFDTLGMKRFKLRPFDCGCGDPAYHREHCTADNCQTTDHHLKGRLCHWQDGDCRCDDARWHGEHCKREVNGTHPEYPHHSSDGCTRAKNASVKRPGYMFICDAGPFFQTSLMKAIDPAEWKGNPVVTAEEWETLKTGKARRDHAGLDDDMRYYNRLENEVLSRLMVRLNEGFTNTGTTGIRLRKDQWFGPGQAAQKWMGTTKLPTTDTQAGCIPIQSYHDVWGTYYAGWFEIFAHGHIPGWSWEYDINSAYPHIASRAPCLLHGTWHHRDRKGKSAKYLGSVDSGKSDSRYAQVDWMRKRRNVPDPVISELPKLREGQWRYVYAHVRGSDKYIGTMSHRSRSDGISIIHPRQTTGWFWQHELEAGIRAKTIDTVECLEWWTYTACDCEPPMLGLAELYEQRLAVGKDTPQGKACKLIYNSVYGKNAQTIGEPKYENIFYASLITAGCRAMILDAIATHPEGTSAVVMIATDAVYFRTRHPGLKLGTGLGEWEEKAKENLTLFKPGVYWDDDARERIRNRESVKFKARGISAADFAGKIGDIDEQFNLWGAVMPEIETIRDDRKTRPEKDGGSMWPEVTFPTSFSMVTCLQGIQRRKWELAGTLGHEPIKDGCQGCSGSHTVQRAIPGGVNWTKDGPVGWGKRGPGHFDGEIYRSSPRELPMGAVGDGANGGLWETSVPWNKENATGKTYGPDDLTPDGSVANVIRESLGLGG